MALANMTQAETDRYNREHCKKIAQDIEKYADGLMYRCPECGEIIEWDNDEYNDDTAEYHCPHCGHIFPENELEPCGLLDYFDDVLDIEYRIGSDRKYRSVELCVAWGGPSIYVDTATEEVRLYWWTDRASYPLSRAAAVAIDEEFESLYDCY